MDRLSTRIAAEAIGTFFLTCSVGLALFQAGSAAPFVVGGSLFSAMAITGFISGAMFNPAVTGGVILYKFLKGDLDKNTMAELCTFFPVQFVFALFGAMVAWAITGHTYHFAVGEDYQAGQAFVAELVWTALLVGCALLIGQTTDSNLVGGLAVGITIITGGYAIGPISGAAFNPAVAVGLSLLDVFQGASFEYWWLYLLAPMMGAGFGTMAAYSVSVELERRLSVKKFLSQETERLV